MTRRRKQPRRSGKGFETCVVPGAGLVCRQVTCVKVDTVFVI
ncbi:MAG: hypothetical protein AAF566_11865 [Pseudomonadota bacterium]